MKVNLSGSTNPKLDVGLPPSNKKGIAMLPSGTKIVVALLLVSVSLVLAGCGGPARPAMAPASGTVLFQGKPLEGAEVVFLSDASPRNASGKTDAQGKFRLTTYENFDGAVLGEYKVTVAKTQINEAMIGNVDDPSASYGAAMAAAAAGKIENKNELPAKYATAESSGLTAKVTKEGPNDFTFDLKAE